MVAASPLARFGRSVVRSAAQSYDQDVDIYGRLENSDPCFD